MGGCLRKNGSITFSVREQIHGIHSEKTFIAFYESTGSLNMSSKSLPKGLKKSDATLVSPLDIVKLNFGQLIDLSLGQTEDSRNYGAVSFGLLRELLIAIVDRMGKSRILIIHTDSDSFSELCFFLLVVISSLVTFDIQIVYNMDILCQV